jgi:hypothetical protein
MQEKAIAWEAAKRLTFSAGPNAALLTAPNTALFIADADYEIVSAAETHETLGTDGSAVTADVVKASDGTALSGGTSMLAATKFNLKATINTEQRKTLSNGGLATSQTDRILYKGQRLGVKFSGTMTAVTGVCITVVLNPLRRAAW